MCSSNGMVNGRKVDGLVTELEMAAARLKTDRSQNTGAVEHVSDTGTGDRSRDKLFFYHILKICLYL